MNNSYLNQTLTSAMKFVKEVVKHGYSTIQVEVQDYDRITGFIIEYQAYNDYPMPKYSPKFASLDECIVWLRNKHAPAPKLIPHTAETFPADGWFVMSKGVNGAKWKVIEVAENDVVTCSAIGGDRQLANFTFLDVLECWNQLMPDGTTKACGQEVAQ